MARGYTVADFADVIDRVRRAIPDAMFGTDLDFDGYEGDADYIQGGILLGWGWPAE